MLRNVLPVLLGIPFEQSIRALFRHSIYPATNVHYDMYIISGESMIARNRTHHPDGINGPKMAQTVDSGRFPAIISLLIII